jgi:hypothetical protein
MTQYVSTSRILLALVGLGTLRRWSRRLPAPYLPSWKRGRNEKAPVTLDFPLQRTGCLAGRGRPPAPADSGPVHVAVEAAGRAGGDALTPCPSDPSTTPESIL